MSELTDLTGVANAVVRAIGSDDLVAAWTHLTADLRLLLVMGPVVEDVMASTVPHDPDRALVWAASVVEQGTRHPAWPVLAPMILALPQVRMIANVPVKLDTQLSATEATVRVGPAVVNMQHADGAWKLASLDPEPVDMGAAWELIAELRAEQAAFRN